MFVFNFHASETPRALEYAREATRLCRRCGFAIFGEHAATDLTIREGDGWGSHSRTVILCEECRCQLDAFLLTAHQTPLDGPGGALSDTAIASMDLAGGGV